MKLHLEVITPEKIVYKEEVDEVIIPTENGQIAILPNHVGLVTRVTPGEMIVKSGKNEHLMAITGGFLEVVDNKVSILAEYAIRAEDVEVAKAQEAQKRAENKIKEKATEHDFRVAEAELQKALLQLRVATKKKRT
ncbi:ATP synthase F1 subunit epsilon [Patescibacteria group bacterium]|nr:ATP synthase F1 subunit epsilon [Patescibacteria group bacterium]